MTAARIRRARLALRDGDRAGARAALEGLDDAPDVCLLRARIEDGAAPDRAIDHAARAFALGRVAGAALAGRIELQRGARDAAAHWFARGLRVEPAHAGCRRGLVALLTEGPLAADPAVQAELAAAIDGGLLDPAPVARSVLAVATGGLDPAVVLARPDAPGHRLLLALLAATVVPDERVEAAVTSILTARDADPDVLTACAAQARATQWLYVPSTDDWLPDPHASDRAEEARIAALLPGLASDGPRPWAHVEAQYTEHPYPRWTSIGAPAPVFLGEHLGRVTDQPLPGLHAPVRILVAGCGTGRHALNTASRYIHRGVLAIDISRPSLAYAERKRRELNIPGVDFVHGAIEQLHQIDERFELIECAGVLHHLTDPVAGWRTLTSLLAPGGVMQIGLYSRAARRCVIAARERLTAAGLTDTHALTKARAVLRALAADDPARAILDWHDAWSRAGLVDLLFHVQETTYDLMEVAEMLEALGLRFLGFDGLPSATHARLTAAGGSPDSLADWHRVEQEHPDTFRRMYQLWVQGPDTAAPGAR